jgi:hypothetical protein
MLYILKVILCILLQLGLRRGASEGLSGLGRSVGGLRAGHRGRAVNTLRAYLHWRTLERDLRARGVAHWVPFGGQLPTSCRLCEATPTETR